MDVLAAKKLESIAKHKAQPSVKTDVKHEQQNVRVHAHARCLDAYSQQVKACSRENKMNACGLQS